MYRIRNLAPLALFTIAAWAQSTPASVPAQIVVTVGHLYGHEPPMLTPADVVVAQQIDPLPITGLIPFRGERADLELFLLVDDCSNCEPGSKFEELRRFIVAQPPTTAIGVAYIKDGHLKIAQTPTPDRELAVRALAAPSGSKPASPFKVLAELIQEWRQGCSRSAVIMISNGVDPTVPDLGLNPSSEEAIEAAQRAGITIYTLYHPSADYLTSDLSRLHSGQIQLAHLAQETGGEAYYENFSPLPSIAPFLADIATHLANQYLLKFLANPVEGVGALRDVTVKCKISNVDLMVPYKVWVPGSGPSEAGISHAGVVHAGVVRAGVVRAGVVRER